MDILLQFFAFIITILLLVSIHEAGHFFVAKLLGIKVTRYAIGFGRPIYRHKSHSGTEYVIGFIPLGGYVKLLDEREVVVPESERAAAFNRQPLWVRTLVVIAGPGMNYLFAIVGFWLMFMIGVEVLRPIVGIVNPGSIAAQAGVMRGDKIVSIDGRQTPSLQKVVLRIVERIGEKDEMMIQTVNSQRNQVINHPLNLEHWSVNKLSPDPLSSLGINPPKNMTNDLKMIRHYSPLIALRTAISETNEYLMFNIIIIKKMILGQISFSTLGGPIAIFQSADLALKQGVSVFLGFLGLISIMLAFLNILPIPGLDGGHLLNYLIEFIIRKPIPLKYEVISIRIGFFILILIMMIATLNDLLRLISS